MKRFFLVLLCLALLTGCTACSGTQTLSSEKLSIVSTVFPPYDFVRAVAGDLVELTLLLPLGSDSHSYDPSLSDIVRIESCDVFLYTGGESDLWAKEVLDVCGQSDVAVLAMTDTVPLLKEETVPGMEHDHGHDHKSVHQSDHEPSTEKDEGHSPSSADHHGDEEGYDEHVWTTPDNAVLILEAITDLLCQKDPAHAEIYRARAAGYVAQLQDLSVQLKEVAATAQRHTLVFADRFPFRYLTQAMGWDYYAAFSGCSAASEVKLKTLVFLTETVKETEVPVIFCTEFADETVAEIICQETGVQKRTLHSCHMISEDDFNAGVTYRDLMQQNILCLKEALCE